TDVNYSDCSAFVTTVLQESGYQNLFKETHTGSGGGGGMQGEIKKMSNASTLTEPYSLTPEEGDVMMWSGHIAIVTQVTDKKVYFAMMGGSGANEYSLPMKDGKINATKEKLAVYGVGDFYGFWTPEEANKNLKAEPVGGGSAVNEVIV